MRTSAHPTLMAVTSMLSVVTLMDLILVRVTLDILEMGQIARVRFSCFTESVKVLVKFPSQLLK